MVSAWNTTGVVRLAISAVALLLLGAMSLVNAAPASPHGFRFKQPDGSSTPLLYLHGDEKYHYETDADGFTVIRDEDNGGWYVYAQHASDGRLVSSGGRVGFVRPQKLGLEPGLRPPAPRRRRHVSDLDFTNEPLPSEPIRRELRFAGERGNPYVLKTLVVLVRFSDHVNRKLPSHTDIEILFNEPGGHPELAPTGSVRDVWIKNSHGRFDMHATATQWIRLPKDEAYYANNESGYANIKSREAFYFAMKHIDEHTDINLQDFDQNKDGYLDSVCFVHSGVAAEFYNNDCETGNGYPQRIWSHRTSGRWTSSVGVKLSSYFVASAIWPDSWKPPCTFDIGRIGAFAHESGHHIGLPDLYDGDYGGRGDGIGNFDFMANMWGWDRTLRNPPHLSPWSKMMLNWVDTVYLDRAQQYELEASIDIDEAYVINHNFPQNEYLIVENRFAKDYDAGIPGGGGLAIYHIDLKVGFQSPGFPGQAGWPNSGRHYQNALLAADGNYDLERENSNVGDGTDLFRAGVAGVANEIGPDGINLDGKPHPNTNAYQGGNVRETGIVIKDISEPGARMTFRLQGVPLEPKGHTSKCEDDETFELKGTRICRRARRKIKKKSLKKVCKRSFVKQNCKRTCKIC